MYIADVSDGSYTKCTEEIIPFFVLYTRKQAGVFRKRPSRVIADGRERLLQWLHTFCPRWSGRTILRQHGQSLGVKITGMML